MTELRPLAYFAAACQQTSLGRAAEVMDVALSSLSAALKSLEDDIGLDLFQRVQGGLAPTAAGQWLYRTATPLLHAEAFARSLTTAGDTAASGYVAVDVRLMFTIGRVSKALDRTIHLLQAEFPATFFEPAWTAHGDPPEPPVLAGERARVVIDYGRDGDVLIEDPWVLARSFPAGTADVPAADAFQSADIAVPVLPDQLLAELARHLDQNAIGNVHFTRENAGELAQLSSAQPGMAFLVPQSMLAARLGHLRLRTRPLSPPLVSPIAARVDGASEAARAFVARLRDELAGPEANTAFDPHITLRQFAYLRLLHSHRSVTVAARIANVAQPAVTGQLRKLEAVVGGSLFERYRDGIVPTEASHRLKAAADIIEARVRTLYLNRAEARGTGPARLSIGVLPAVGYDGYLLTRVSDAVVRWRDDHPGIILKIVEAPNATLQEWVQAGTISLAVVETDLPRMARFSLRASEALAVVANPAHDLLPPGPVDFRSLARLPLALPTESFGIRHLLDMSANAAGVTLTPRIEVNSLPMLISLVTRTALCTVLPPSAIPRQLREGELISRPIVPAVERRLYVIYSSARALTPAERSLITLLKEEFAEARATASLLP
ncbi:MAG: LysR substrate-binding domain-containing protein [Pseudomonadota bacterium]